MSLFFADLLVILTSCLILVVRVKYALHILLCNSTFACVGIPVKYHAPSLLFAFLRYQHYPCNCETSAVVLRLRPTYFGLQIKLVEVSGEVSFLNIPLECLKHRLKHW